MGNEIAFAPGKFNMGSFSGQALLGHELAHIGQQARGEVSGGGLVRNSSFEHQADVQGMMAARGETAVSPASSAQIAPMSAAPIQARESKSERKARSRQVSAWKAGMQQQYEQEGRFGRRAPTPIRPIRLPVIVRIPSVQRQTKPPARWPTPWPR